MNSPFLIKLCITVSMVFLLGEVCHAQMRVPVYYTVKPQEGLYRVALNNNVTMEEIRRWNHLTSDNLSIGQRLIVGYKTEESHTEPVKEQEPEMRYDAGNTSKYYTVQPGEGLYRVAVNNKVTMAEIRSWNNLTSDALSAGQRLIVGYEVAAPGEQPVEAEETDDKQARYEDALARGNKSLEEHRYAEAKTIFEEAMVINPKSYIAKKRIAEIDALLSQQQASIVNIQSAETQVAVTSVIAETITTETHPMMVEAPPKDAYSAYWFYVKKGDTAMNTQNYREALTSYQEASKIYPSKAYPKTKIKEIKDQYLAEDTIASVTIDTASKTTLLMETTVSQGLTAETPEAPGEPSFFEVENKRSLIAYTHFAVLKSKPSDFSKLLDYIPENTEVTIVGFNNNMRDYYEVSYNGKIGWVPEKNVKKTKEVTTFKKELKEAAKSRG